MISREVQWLFWKGHKTSSNKANVEIFHTFLLSGVTKLIGFNRALDFAEKLKSGGTNVC